VPIPAASRGRNHAAFFLIGFRVTDSTRLRLQGALARIRFELCFIGDRANHGWWNRTLDFREATLIVTEAPQISRQLHRPSASGVEGASRAEHAAALSVPLLSWRLSIESDVRLQGAGTWTPNILG